MSSTDTSSSSDDSDSSDSLIVVNTPATRVDARRLFDGMPPPVDRIGALPDGVIHYLLSFLPVQEAVRTCVLARRWRHLWKSTTGLRIVGAKGPVSVRDLRKFVDHLLILRERTDLDTVEIGFSKLREEDVPFVNLWIRFALESKVRALSVCHKHANQPFSLVGLPFASRYLTTLGLHGARLKGTFLDFSSCPALDDLKISLCVINVSKIASRSLKHLKMFRCWSSLDQRVRVSAPCLVSFKLDGFSGRSPLLERMPLLETAFLNFGVLPHTPNDICLHYSRSGVFCGANDVKCVNCLYNDGSSNSSVLLGALDNAKHLKLEYPSGMIIFTRDLEWCPTFNNLRNLLLNDYWCVGPDFSALTCILKHCPVLEELTLQLVSEGVRPKVEMKGSYSSMERSTVFSQHLKIVNVKCNVVDEKVAKVLKFLCTLNLRFCFV
uniref:Uncharacterized protein n=1 Tax=Avena sativa TaxID=4498 RepID=A0ACD5X8P8_AVESA